MLCLRLIKRYSAEICIILCVASGHVGIAQLPDEAIVHRDIEFARPGGHSLLLDVMCPAESAQATPVVVFVHGGGWKNGSRRSGEKNAGWLIREGFAVVSIDYRLTDVAQWPAQIDDCYESVRWVRRNAKKYNFDPDQIAAWGTSAGGHLAVLMGTRAFPGKEDTSSRVQAVCDWFGPTDLLSMPPNCVGNGRTAKEVANSNGAKLLGQTVRDAPELARDASGLFHASKESCPILIMHGSQDPGVPLEQSQRLHKRLAELNVTSRLHRVEGAGHGGKLFHTPESHAVVRAFLSKHLMKNWPQGPGPNGDFRSDTSFTFDWDVQAEDSIRWRKKLPETGQSTVVVFGNRLFFTTMEEVTKDTELGSNIVAWCCDANSGDTLWSRAVTAEYPLRLSGCFSDSSAPPPVTDGERVCFFNASGRITCFDYDGNRIWSREIMPTGRSQPFLSDGKVVFTRQQYMPVKGHFTHEHREAPPEEWTNLQALDFQTGKDAWGSKCGVNMGCVPLPMTLQDGREVIVVGRGGGHSPPERPEGISLVSAKDGSTIWTLRLDGYMSTQTYCIYKDQVLAFHADKHLWIDAITGRIIRTVSLVEDIQVFDVRSPGTIRRETIPDGGKRNIIQQSNVLAGRFHYFRSYTRPYIGRVDAIDGSVQYVQVPVQVRQAGEADERESLWTESDLQTPIPRDKRKRAFRVGTSISYVAFEPNDVRNSRGFVVMGDDRSQANGWGHHASPIPTLCGNALYIPVMSGLVYVHQVTPGSIGDGETRIHSLGAINRTWTRSSISFSGNALYGRTIRELICIDRAN